MDTEVADNRLQRVDDRLVSRLRSSEHVRMDKYHDEQLYDILSARAKWGLDEDVITDDQLYRIADAAAGDARLAIGILRTAAGKADSENHERITDDILLDAAEDTRAQIKQKSLDSIMSHQHVVYEVIIALVGRVLLTESMHPRDLLLQERLCTTMSAKGQLRRFENRAQLLRHISEETGTDIDTLWDEYEAQVE